jgi:serine/threonine protein phosphatase PrpC
MKMNIFKKLFGGRGKQESPAADLIESVHGLTDVGMDRDNNEDYFLVNSSKNLFIVADGMGGHNAGEVASMNATEAVNDHFTSEILAEIKGDRIKINDELNDCLYAANQKILDMAETNTGYRGMGCTLVVALVETGALHMGHVGDARAYLCNENGIHLLTTDHSKVMELVKAGQMTLEEARQSPLKNELGQAIGSPLPIIPDYNFCELKNGDKVLLCSDGLWDMLSDKEIYQIVKQAKPAQSICEELVRKANDAGGHDNITVVLIEYRETNPQTNP